MKIRRISALSILLFALSPLAQGDEAARQVTWDDLAAHYEVQAAGLIEGGVDVLLLETSQDTLNVKAGLVGIDRAQKRLGTHVPGRTHDQGDAGNVADGRRRGHFEEIRRQDGQPESTRRQGPVCQSRDGRVERRLVSDVDSLQQQGDHAGLGNHAPKRDD